MHSDQSVEMKKERENRKDERIERMSMHSGQSVEMKKERENRKDERIERTRE